MEQFESWAGSYALHQRECTEGCKPGFPKCPEGYQIASKCVSLGPVAWYKETHEKVCPVCSAGLICDDGDRLWEQSVERFNKYMYRV